MTQTALIRNQINYKHNYIFILLTEGRDYSGESHVFTIPPQDSSVNININITDDSNVEEKEEMFRLLLEFTQMTHDRVIIGQINHTDIFIQDDDGMFISGLNMFEIQIQINNFDKDVQIFFLLRI